MLKYKSLSTVIIFEVITKGHRCKNKTKLLALKLNTNQGLLGNKK
jgi:hypothetical protein